jgi:hypothetical protein
MNIRQRSETYDTEAISTIHIPGPTNGINVIDTEHGIFIFEVELSCVRIDGIQGDLRLDGNMRTKNSVAAKQRQASYNQGPQIFDNNRC